MPYSMEPGKEGCIVKRCAAWALLSLTVIGVFSAGCAPAISKAVRAQVDRNLFFSEVLRAPDDHRGKTVLWGGDILSTLNRKDGTVIEILQKPLDYENRPKDVDASGGRFLAFYGAYLDPAIYAEGRQVTVAGPILGKEVRPLGEIEYTYPLVRPVEIHLWPKRAKEPMYVYPDPFWHDRWWWGRHPYWWP